MILVCEEVIVSISQKSNGHLSLGGMHRYFIKTPRFIPWIFSSYIWRLPAEENAVYLTFDDGPHPTITPWVLEELKKYNAQATFFCIGKNVVHYPEVYKRILAEGHAVGNHTFQHLNGWNTSTEVYLQDVAKAADEIDTNLFRPPYGRISKKEANGIPFSLKRRDAQVIMWDVLSGDFDTTISPQKCLRNVLQHTEAGSIVVFHDSEKASENLFYALPRVLQLLSEKGSLLKKIII